MTAYRDRLNAGEYAPPDEEEPAEDEQAQDDEAEPETDDDVQKPATPQKQRRRRASG